MACLAGIAACKDGDGMLVVQLVPPTPAVTADRLVFTVAKAGQPDFTRTHTGGFEAMTASYALQGIPAKYEGSVQLRAAAWMGSCQVAAADPIEATLSAGKSVTVAYPLTAKARSCGGPPPPDAGDLPEAGADASEPADAADAGAPEDTMAPLPPDAGPGPDAAIWNPLGPNFMGDQPTLPRLAAVDGKHAYLAWRRASPSVGIAVGDLPDKPTLGNPKPDNTDLPTGLALIRDDTGEHPYIAWAETSKVLVKRFDASWVQLGDPFGAPGIVTAADCPALVFDASGKLVVAWPQGSPASIYLRGWTGTAWDASHAGPLRGGTGDAGCPLLAQRAGTLAAAWVEASAQGKQLHVQRYAGGGWQAWGGPLSPAAGATAVRLGGLVLDGEGLPTVAWQESTPGKSTVVVRRWDKAGMWVQAGGSIPEITAPGADGPPALAIDAQNPAATPLLAWFDYASTKLSVRVWQLEGGAWTPKGSALRGKNGDPAEIALSYGGGVPWVVFTDVSTGSTGFYLWAFK